MRMDAEERFNRAAYADVAAIIGGDLVFILWATASRGSGADFRMWLPELSEAR
jgi:hypothetical protein